MNPFIELIAAVREVLGEVDQQLRDLVMWNARMALPDDDPQRPARGPRRANRLQTEWAQEHATNDLRLAEEAARAAMLVMGCSPLEAGRLLREVREPLLALLRWPLEAPDTLTAEEVLQRIGDGTGDVLGVEGWLAPRREAVRQALLPLEDLAAAWAPPSAAPAQPQPSAIAEGQTGGGAQQPEPAPAAQGQPAEAAEAQEEPEVQPVPVNPPHYTPAAQAVLEALMEGGEATPEQLETRSGYKINTVRNALTELHEGGAVTRRREGKRAFYQVAAGNVSPP